MNKVCLKCNNEKSIEFFYKKKTSKDGFMSSCKDCCILLQSTKQKEYKEKYLSYQKLYRSRTKEERAEKDKVYYLKNKEHIIENKRIYNNFKRNTDEIYKLKSNLRSRILVALKNNFKVGSVIRDLGCSIEELKQHLESKFKDGMSWENQGKWHIDHIRPLSSFDLINREQFLQACHFSNLQPLWAEENLRKSNKYDTN
jgi:hypothetical protein